MYSTTTAYKTSIAAAGRKLNGYVQVGATTYQNDTLVSIYFEDSVCPDTFFEVGTVSSAYIEVTLLNITGNFDGQVVKPYIGIDTTGTGSYEYVPLGIFTVEETVKNRSLLTLKCFDKMVLLENPYTTTLTYPATLTAIMNEICTKNGVTFSGSLPAYTVTKPDTVNNTYRDVVGLIAGVAGGFAKFDRTGVLNIKNFTLTPTPVRTIDGSDYFELNKADAVYTVGKVTIKDNNANLPFSNGTLTSSNMELVIINSWANTTIANDLYAKLNTLSFLPVDMTWQADPSLDLGDWVTISEYGASSFNTLLTDVKFTFSGGLSGNFTSTGESKTKNTYNTNPTDQTNPIASGQNYNGVVVDGVNGIVITSTQNTIKFNATDGLKLTRNSDGAVMISLDSSGNAVFSGSLSGASGTFNGTINGDSLVITPKSGAYGMISFDQITQRYVLRQYLSSDGTMVFDALDKVNNFNVINLVSFIVKATNIDFSTGDLSVRGIATGVNGITLTSGGTIAIVGLSSTTIGLDMGNSTIGNVSNIVTTNTTLNGTLSTGGSTLIQQNTMTSGTVNGQTINFNNSSGTAILQYTGGFLTAPGQSLSISQNTVKANTITQLSNADFKKNIQDWNYNATDMIVSTPIRQYQYNIELDSEFPHVGIIVQESPVWVVSLEGDGVEPSAMSALSWKAIQELNARILVLENKLGGAA